VLYIEIVDKYPWSAHAIKNAPEPAILRLLQWKRMIAAKKMAIFHIFTGIFLLIPGMSQD